MLSSNEPGYYLEGEYGIRIENLMVVVEDKEGWLKFDTITLFPIATNLIDMNFMTTTETQWLNDYHQETYDKVSGASKDNFELISEEFVTAKSKFNEIKNKEIKKFNSYLVKSGKELTKLKSKKDFLEK